MRLKTRYREEKHLAEKIAEEIPPSEKHSLNDDPAPSAVAPDPATLRLKEQLAALQHSEAAQRLMHFAASPAAQGHQPGSPDHQRATRQIFDQHLQAAASGGQPSQSEPSEPPEFFRPPPSPPEPDRAAMYSAPVSREGTSAGYREPSPSSVRLSPAQREAARYAGISEVDYAKQLMKLPAYKRERGVEQE